MKDNLLESFEQLQSEFSREYSKEEVDAFVKLYIDANVRELIHESRKFSRVWPD